MLNWLFGRTESSASGDLSEHLPYLETLRLAAVHLFYGGEGFSKIGGLPNLPLSIDWPMWKDEPLAFLCQVDTSELPVEAQALGLSSSGCLFFFYDREQRTWGFDPKDSGSFRVLYVDASCRDCEERAMPGATDVLYKEARVTARMVRTYPDSQDSEIDSLKFDDAQEDAYCALKDSVFDGAPMHHLGGHPSPEQDNYMEMESQLASNGVYLGDPEGYTSQRAKELEAGAADWVLLLQLDTDERLGMMWGDMGKLYFWIRKQDLAARRFDAVWMILQCG